MRTHQCRLAHPVGMALLATVLATAAGCGRHSPMPMPGQLSSPETAASSSATSAFPSERPAPSSATVAQSSAAPGTPANTGSSSTCKVTELKAVLGPRDAATGHVDSSIQFTNIGSRTCVLSGFPGISYVTSDTGRQVGAPAERDGAIGPPVSLSPGQVASAALRITNAGMYDPGACQQTPVRGLRVYPPGDTDTLFIPFDFDASGCAGNVPTPQLAVRTVTAGTGG